MAQGRRCRQAGRQADGQAAATHATKGCWTRSQESTAETVAERTSRPWTVKRERRTGQAEEGGLGIMKGSVVEAPDG